MPGGGRWVTTAGMADAARPSNFLTDIIDADLATGRNGGRVVTRFPPEPNGHLHLGHAKSILLNFGLAARYGGRVHLRFDDTNPTTEEVEYVEGIQADVRWLAGDWSALYYASDFFERMYQAAERLIREGHAYVDSQSQEAIREQRGDFGRPGTNSPFRDRPAEESLDLFRRMRSGQFADGACVLRARIDMAHPNLVMRDPLLYRIRKAHHHRTGDAWCIYPMYDFAHPLEDAFEGVTHSICTLEFESNRELYDWVLDRLGPWDPRPRQHEFARLSLGYTVLSKRKLLQLVTEKRVAGWDDPRMPTLAGMRRRGITPEALRDFADLIGVAKNNSTVDIGKLEFAIRGDLEARCPRALAVLDPLPLTITTWPAGKVETLELPWWPADPARGTRPVPCSGQLLIERDDFSLEPPPGWKRLAPGGSVRLAGRLGGPLRRGAARPRRRRHRPALQPRPRLAGRRRRRPARPRHHPLGRRRPLGAGPGAALRPALRRRAARRGPRLPGRAQPRLAGGGGPGAPGAGAGHGRARRSLPVPPARLLHRRPGRLQAGRAGLQPDHHAARRLGPAGGPARAAPGVEAEGGARRDATPRPGRSDARAERRAATPALAERYLRYQQALRLPEEQADLLSRRSGRGRLLRRRA